MSFLLRQLCITLVIAIVISCSQLQDRPWEDGVDEDKRSQMPRLRIGRSLPLETESVPEEEEEMLDEANKRFPYLKIGNPENQPLYEEKRAAGGDKTFLRIGRAPSDSTFLRIGRSPFLRIGRSPFLRIGRSPFLRIGRSPFLRIGRSPFLRIGRPSLVETSGPMNERRSNDKTFLRIGRGAQSFLRIGRANEMLNDDALDAADGNRDSELAGVEIDTAGTMGKRGLRIGKRLIGAFSQGTTNDLTPDELQLLKANKDLLLQYMQSHPELFGDEQNTDDDAYFAFPRQGRAMSFYFPRMGRSGDDDLSSPYCCEEGVRKVYKIGKESQDLCSSEKPCCPGFVEQEKVYKDIIITECAVKSGSDKFRNYINDE